MRISLLDNIDRDEVEHLRLYRLGVFENSSYEFVEMYAGENYLPHYHNNSDAKFHFILGEGKITLDGIEKQYKKGDSFTIPKGVSHGFSPATDTLLLTIQTPPIKDLTTGKEDIHFFDKAD